jgi:hypothetical protein
MRIELLNQTDSPAELMKGCGSVGDLHPYFNKVTGQSDPMLRFDGRPAFLMHLSDVPHHKIKNLDTGEITPVADLMDYGVEA